MGMSQADIEEDLDRTHNAECAAALGKIIDVLQPFSSTDRDKIVKTVCVFLDIVHRDEY